MGMFCIWNSSTVPVVAPPFHLGIQIESDTDYDKPNESIEVKCVFKSPSGVELATAGAKLSQSEPKKLEGIPVFLNISVPVQSMLLPEYGVYTIECLIENLLAHTTYFGLRDANGAI